MASRMKGKADIRELREIADKLKPEMYQYKITMKMKGSEMILTALPLPDGCNRVSQVKKNGVYEVHYSGFRYSDHFKRLKLATKGKSGDDYINAVDNYCKPFAI